MHEKSNNKCKVHVHKGKTDKLSKNCYGMIGTLKKGVLRITNNNKWLCGSELTQYESKPLSEEVMQAIKNNEAIVATDASFKNDKMGGAWTIKDDYRINRCKREILSNQ